MDKDRRELVALGRYSIVATLINERSRFQTDKSLFLYGASLPFMIDGEVQRPVTWYTIRNWYQAYEQGGFDALLPVPRKDKGQFRKVDDNLQQSISSYLQINPEMPSTKIFYELKKEGEIMDGEVSLSTVTRCAGSIKKALPDDPEDIRRYEKENRNAVWYGDTMHALQIKVNGESRKVYIMALIDDATRMIVGYRACLHDDKYNLHVMIGEAVAKYGVPNLFVFDNGSNYRSKSVKLLIARIGSDIHFCHPYSPREKAKIERFNRTLRDQFLSYLSPEDVRDLDSFNLSLSAYIKRYNSSMHSSISDTPIHRFFSDPAKIRRIDDDKLNECLLIEDTRTVSIDRIIQVNNIEYEVPAQYSRRKITILENPERTRVWILEGNARTEVFEVDKHENAKSGRRLNLSRVRQEAKHPDPNGQNPDPSDKDQKEKKEKWK